MRDFAHTLQRHCGPLNVHLPPRSAASGWHGESLTDRWKWPRLQGGSTFCVWSQSWRKRWPTSPCRRDHQPEGKEGGSGHAPATITILTCHPPQLETSTASLLKHAQSNLHLHHVCRKQYEHFTKQCPPAGNTAPLCYLLPILQKLNRSVYGMQLMLLSNVKQSQSRPHQQRRK